MLLLKPTDAQLEHARLFADIYASNGYGKNVLQVSNEEYLHFIRIGKLCEIVFVDFLRKQKITVSADEILLPKAGNHRKGADFVLQHSNQSVDVKAANKAFHKRILIREDQFRADIHDIYLAAKYIDDSALEYHGYIMGTELQNTIPKDFGYGLCRYMLLQEVKPIERFLDLCIRQEKIE